MTMCCGTEVYNADSAPITARGAVYNADELQTSLAARVCDILWDTAGTNPLQDVLTTLVTTEFSTESIKRILSTPQPPENWRVGEGLAEAFLSDNRQCEFPWPTGRDLKNPNASPAGTDLVGFQKTSDSDNPYRFAFGEVKTSEQEQWPPNVATGRHGLEKQIENLKSHNEAKDALVKYLGHHVPNTAQYRSATKRYLKEPTDVSLFGFLVRDVTPKQEDLAARARNIASECPAQTQVELRAIYLPAGSIPQLSQHAIAAKAGGRA